MYVDKDSLTQVRLVVGYRMQNYLDPNSIFSYPLASRLSRNKLLHKSFGEMQSLFLSILAQQQTLLGKV